MHIIPLIFWGSAVLSLGLSVGGVVSRKGWMLVAGAALAIPMSFYLGGTPRFEVWAWFLPCLQLVAASMVRKSAVAAAVLLIPFVSLILWLAVSVIRQNAGASSPAGAAGSFLAFGSELAAETLRPLGGIESWNVAGLARLASGEAPQVSWYSKRR